MNVITREINGHVFPNHIIARAREHFRLLQIRAKKFANEIEIPFVCVEIACRQVHFLHDGDLLIQASSVSRSAFGIRVRAVQTLLGMDSLIATSLEELCMKMGCTQLYAFANATLQQYQTLYIDKLPHKTRVVVERQKAELRLAAVVVCAKHRREKIVDINPFLTSLHVRKKQFIAMSKSVEKICQTILLQSRAETDALSEITKPCSSKKSTLQKTSSARTIVTTSKKRRKSLQQVIQLIDNNQIDIVLPLPKPLPKIKSPTKTIITKEEYAAWKDRILSLRTEKI